MDPDLAPAGDDPLVEVRGVTVQSGSRVLQRNLSFAVGRGRFLAVVGEAGAGKRALFRGMVGLAPPAEGDIFYSGRALWGGSTSERARLAARLGVLLSGGALVTTKTLLENVALPLQVHTPLEPADAFAVARLELALIGLAGYEHHYPAEVDEFRRLCAGLARAVVLRPEVLFCEEPTAGLDPMSSSRLRDAILRIRDDLGAAVVVVSNDLTMVFAADDVVILGRETKTMQATGHPAFLRDHCPDPDVRAFLSGRT